MIIKPKYINNVEVTNPLYERFNDTTVKFYKTKYIISEQFYTPKITQDSDGNIVYPQMPKLFSKDNKLLFPKEFSNYTDYRLLNEEVTRDVNIPEYITITETWGYTPTIQFNEPSVVSWQKPGMYDTSSTPVTANVIKSKFPIENSHTVYINNFDGKFKAGDVVRFYMPMFQKGGSTIFAQEGEPITITSAASDYILVPIFKINILNLDGSVRNTMDSATYNAAADLFSMFYWQRDNPVICSIGVNLYAKTRSPYSGDFPCSVNSRFIRIQSRTDLLNLQPAWTVKLSGQDTDTLTKYTVPTIDEYNANIGTTNVLLAAAETLEKLIGDIYIIQRKYIRYQ